MRPLLLLAAAALAAAAAVSPASAAAGCPEYWRPHGTGVTNPLSGREITVCYPA